MKHHLKKSLNRIGRFLLDLSTPGTWAWRAFLAFGVGAFAMRLYAAQSFGWLDIGLAAAYGGMVTAEVQRFFHNRQMRYALDILTLSQVTAETLLKMYNDLRDLHEDAAPQTKPRSDALVH